jgi:hypothetical protein
MSIQEMATILKQEYAGRGYKVSNRPIPVWLLRILGRFNGQVRLAVDMLDVKHDVSVAKAQRELGWTPKPLREVLIESADLLISSGMVQPKKAPAAA